MNEATLEQAREAKAALRVLLSGLPELRGIGVAFLENGYGVKILVERLPASIVIPEQVNGVPVVIDIVDELTLL